MIIGMGRVPELKISPAQIRGSDQEYRSVSTLVVITIQVSYLVSRSILNQGIWLTHRYLRVSRDRL
jgi:hypothetical protein